ncbi:MAG: Cdc6/Cdc18 family protein [archaeon]
MVEDNNKNNDDIEEYFSSYMKSKPVFKNKKYLQSNYIPDEVIHRKEEIKHMARILAPSLRGERPSNLFIYGKTGTGKTLTIQHVIKKMHKAYDVSGNKDFHLNIIYVNCKLKRVADTEYRLIAHLARNLGKDIPPTGLPTDEVYNIFTSAIEEKKTSSNFNT